MAAGVAAKLDGKAELTAEDALEARRIIFADGGPVTQEGADTLFRLNADAGKISPEWRALFVEALVEFVVHQQDPVGYVDDGKASWLVDAIKRQQRIREDEIEMLVHVIETAEQSPAALTSFALTAAKTLVVAKLARRHVLEKRDVELMRRLVFAMGSERSDGVSQSEAEALFDINDAIADAAVDPSWQDLFVKGVANAVLFDPLWAPVDRAAERKEEAWVEDSRPGQFLRYGRRPTAGTMGAAFRQVVDIVRHPFGPSDLEQEMIEAELKDEATEKDAERLTDSEAHWLVDRLNRNGRRDANEQALVAFVLANADGCGPQIKGMLEQIASPAEQQTLSA